MRWISHDLIILDEVGAGRTETRHQFAGLFGGKPDIRLDDRANDRSVGDAEQVAAPGYAMAGTVELSNVGCGKGQIEQPNPGQLPEIIDIARRRADQGREICPDIVDRLGDRDDGTPTWHEHA